MQRRAVASCCHRLYTQCSATASSSWIQPSSSGVTALQAASGAVPACLHAALGRALLQQGLWPAGAWRALTSMSQVSQLQSASQQAALNRSLTTSARLQQQQVQQQQSPAQKAQEAAYDSLELTQEKIHALTDKIPQRPVGVVEGASYSLIILAAFGVLAFIVWHFVNTFILEPTALQCFNHTLNYLKTDPRVTVRLGSTDDIRAWGSNSSSRVARQQIPHQIYKDATGTEHVRIQFYMRGPSGTGLVNADMFKDTAGAWQYTYLLMDVYGANSNTPSRVYIIRPQ